MRLQIFILRRKQRFSCYDIIFRASYSISPDEIVKHSIICFWKFTINVQSPYIQLYCYTPTSNRKFTDGKEAVAHKPEIIKDKYHIWQKSQQFFLQRTNNSIFCHQLFKNLDAVYNFCLSFTIFIVDKDNNQIKQ